MILIITALTKYFGGEGIFHDVSLAVNEGDRIGIVGENGAGKSTLIRILTGKLDYDRGSVQLTRGKRVGVLYQDSGLNRQGTIKGEMEKAYPKLQSLKKRIREMEENSDTGEAYAELLSRFAQLGGYEMDVEIEKVLNGMGFVGVPRETPIHTLSGGQKTRLALCKLLCETPDLMILDEPTNHLDLATLTWLEEYLSKWKHALLVVSHDRYFLDGVTDHIWEVEDGTVTAYKGNYSAYVRQKDERLSLQQKEYELQQQEIHKMETYVEKNLARASTAKSAKSRIAALERMERIDKPKAPKKLPPIQFTFERETGKDVLDVSDLTLEIGGKRLCKEAIQLHLKRGEKLGIIGVNGAGKSTLLKTLNGLLPDQGKVRWGDNTRLGYYDQEHLSVNPENTVLEELWSRYPRLSQQQVRGCLGRFQIIGEDVFKKVGTLSGGERAKLLFAVLTLLHPNVLLLDEPTNHLDLSTRTRLERALMEYTGTIVCVSHDRYFLNAMPNKIAELTAEGWKLYSGRYDDYLMAVKAEKAADASPHMAESPREEKRPGKERRKEQAKARAERSRIEKQLEETEAKITETEREMEQVYADPKRLQELCKGLEKLKQEQDDWMEKWVALDE